MPSFLADIQVNDTAHIIQVALTPVFLLSGIGTLLNVFNTRMARVADHAEHITDMLRQDNGTQDIAALRKHLVRLYQRRSVLDTAIVLGALGGAATCIAAFTLFLVTAREAAGGLALFLLFGAALFCTVGALIAFLIDGLMAWHGIRIDGSVPGATAGAKLT